MKREIYEKIKDELPPQMIKDIETYGLEHFTFEIIDSAENQEELDRKQKEYIKKFNTLEPHGYNMPNE